MGALITSFSAFPITELIKIKTGTNGLSKSMAQELLTGFPNLGRGAKH